MKRLEASCRLLVITPQIQDMFTSLNVRTRHPLCGNRTFLSQDVRINKSCLHVFHYTLVLQQPKELISV